MKKNNILFLISILISINFYAQTPAHYWSFNGNPNDAVGASNGVLFGDTQLTTGKDGQPNTAYYLDGADDYIQLPNPQYPAMTIAFWIKPDGITNDTRILTSLNTTSTSAFTARYNNESIEVWSPWKPVISGYDQTNQSKWSLICLTIDASRNITAYLNGVPSSPQNFTYQWSSHFGIGRKFIVGSQSYGYDYKGSVDDVMIFDKILSAQEIQNLYTNNASVVENFCETLYCNDGKIGIGTANPDMKLTVNGKIHTKGVKVDLSIPAPDYVFKENYDLKSIEEVEKFIIKNNHLPEIPSAKEFEKNGVMLAKMDMDLLKKVEELTLYLIEQNKQLEKANQNIEKLQKEVAVLKKK